MAMFDALDSHKRMRFFDWLNLKRKEQEDVCGKSCWKARPCSPATFSSQIIRKLVHFLKIETVIYLLFNMPGASNMAILILNDMLYPCLAFSKL